MPSVWFDPDDECLVFATGERATVGSSWDSVLVDERTLVGVPINELATAFGHLTSADARAQTLGLELIDGVSDESYPSAAIAFVRSGTEMHAVAISEIPLHFDEEYEDKLAGLLKPLADRRGAEFIRVCDDGMGLGLASAELRLIDADGHADTLLRIAADARALMIALRNGPLDAQAARDLLAGGHARALEGLPEGSWIDVKRKPHDAGAGRSGERAKWELAKDVAAFANAKGGIIVVPGTEKLEGGQSVITEIGEIPLSEVSVQRIRSVLAEHVYPDVDGLEIGVRENSPDQGVHWIFVPEQPEHVKPFLVHGAAADDKVVTTHVSLPRRSGAHTRHAPIAEIHAQLVAGRGRQLGREEILDWVRRDQLPWGFRELVEEAEAVGISVAVGNGAVRFSAADGRHIDSHYAWVPDVMLSHEISRLCAELQAYGIEVRRAPTGQLLPANLHSG